MSLGRKTGRCKMRAQTAPVIANGEKMSALAQTHAEIAMATLVEIAQEGQTESARVSAAIANLDRGYGKPKQAVDLKDREGPVALAITRIERVIISPPYRKLWRDPPTEAETPAGDFTRQSGVK